MTEKLATRGLPADHSPCVAQTPGAADTCHREVLLVEYLIVEVSIGLWATLNGGPRSREGIPGGRVKMQADEFGRFLWAERSLGLGSAARRKKARLPTTVNLYWYYPYYLRIAN